MVEFVSDSTNNDVLHASKLNKSKEPLDSLNSKANDYSFVDSFLDYESIEDWIEELTTPVMTDAETVVIEADEKRVDSTVEGQFINRSEPASDPIVERSVPAVDKAEPIVLGSETAVVQGESCDKSGDFNFFIEEGMSKVSLVAESGSLVFDGGNTVKSKLECHEDDSESDAESQDTSSSSTSSSSSSSDGSEDVDDEENSSSSTSGSSSCDEDEDEENEIIVNAEGDGEIGDLEEGEIRDVDIAEMTDGTDDDSEDEEAQRIVAWYDDDEEEDEYEDNEEAGVKGGPIRSENELKVLPLVPRVYATLQPHHQMLPVGVVLSVIKNQVIVEGVEKHNPLSEGSVLWITESRSPLGLVDEIFGPVKNPYYSVRYNSESEVPTGIHGGAHISFVPEFSNFVLNNKDLYKKGYDASGKNDEEVSDEEEFSDDEKELEFKRFQRLAKRSMNDQKDGNSNNTRKNIRARKFGQPTSQHARMPETRKNGQPAAQQTKVPLPGKFGQPTFQQANMNTVQPSSNQNQRTVSPLASFADHGSCPNSLAAGQCFINATGVSPSFPPMYNHSFAPTLNGIWPTNMPLQQQQLPNLPLQQQQPNLPFQQQQPNLPFQHQQPDPCFPNTVPMNGMPWLLHNPAPSPQMPMLNTFTGLAYPQGHMGTALPGIPYPLTGGGEQGIHPGELQFGQNHNMRPPLTMPGSMEAPQQFNPWNLHPPVELPGNVAVAQQFSPGTSSSRGRIPHSRGGAHFRGRRGRRQRR